MPGSAYTRRVNGKRIGLLDSFRLATRVKSFTEAIGRDLMVVFLLRCLHASRTELYHSFIFSPHRINLIESYLICQVYSVMVKYREVPEREIKLLF